MAIVKCTCDNIGQDKIYGMKNRVANKTSSAPQITYRCTVCEKIIEESKIINR